MNTAEIVVGKMQSARCFQVHQFLAESVRQPREPPKLHPHREILPLYKAGRDVLGIGIASSDLGYNLDDWTWASWKSNRSLFSRWLI